VAQQNMPLTKRRLAECTGGEPRQAASRRPRSPPPSGTHEDQGPHVPMGDDLTAAAVALRIAARATDTGTETPVAQLLQRVGAKDLAGMPRGIPLSRSMSRSVLDEVPGRPPSRELTGVARGAALPETDRVI
jgi:creatinine amidohydrolase